MDRLPWSAFHWRMIFALGITWVLDGIEIGLASAVGDVLRHKETLALDAQTVGLSGTLYLTGEVLGALYFGRKADKLGRRKLFIVTLALYLVANGLTSLSFSTWFFLLTRFIAGMGIGGEYAAIHSAIDELTPARYRGRVDIAIAGTYWAGAAIAAGAQILLLNPDLIPIDLGWRISLVLGPLIGLSIWPLRKYIPESPRWQLTHGMEKEAEATVDAIEADLRAKGVVLPDVDPAHAIAIRKQKEPSILEVASILFRKYFKRLVLGVTLMGTQSFLYNAIFFTYALVLTQFYDVSATRVPLYGLAFSVGNLMGPLLLAPLFDTVGRRKMISGTYILSGVLLAISGWLFDNGDLTANSQTFVWIVIFFFASAGASSAYLTVSETWPIEIRAEAIAVFFAIAQLFGALGPAFYGWLIGDGQSRTGLFIGYLIGGGIMIFGGIIEIIFGINAEGKSLEDVTKPLTATDEPAPAASAVPGPA